MNAPNRRLKRVMVSINSLMPLLKAPGAGVRVVDNALPEDATIAAVELDETVNMLILVMHSSTYEEVPEDADPPIASFPVLEPLPLPVQSHGRVPTFGQPSFGA